MRFSQSRLGAHSAFTLIELLVVILVIGILVAVAAPSFLGQSDKAHDSNAKQSLVVAYKAAKADAVAREGKYVAAGFDAQALALALKASEPQMDFAPGSCPLGVTSRNPAFVIIDSDLTSDNDLVLCNDPELRVWTLSSIDYAAPSFTLSGGGVDTGGAGGGNPDVAVANTSPPTVSGTAATGQLLTVDSNGNWDGAPVFFHYQWQLFDGTVWSDVGTDAPTFTPDFAVDNKPLHVIVAASRAGAPVAGSSGTATSAQTLPVLEHVENLAAPVISDLSPATNVELTVTNGDWQGGSAGLPLSYSYSWQSLQGAVWIAVGANLPSFTPTPSEAGTQLRVRVTAARSGSSNIALSAETAAVIGPVVNSAPPVISGTPATGVQLSSTNDAWTGAPSTYVYQWQSSPTGAVWSDVGLNLATFTPQASEAGKQIRVTVTASRPGASNSASSDATAAVQGPPGSSALPALSSNASLAAPLSGDTLTSTSGSWNGTPTSYAYQWQRCDAAGANCVNIGSANTAAYTLATADLGKTLRSEVSASNLGGTSAARSDASASVSAPVAPANTSAPTISGTVAVGQTLTAAAGSWSGAPAPSYAYQWQRCQSRDAAIKQAAPNVWFRFGTGGGLGATDSSGNGQHLTAYGSAQQASTGKAGDSCPTTAPETNSSWYYPPGSTESTGPYITALTATTSVSVEAWFQIASWTQVTHALISSPGWNSNYSGYTLYASNGALSWAVGNGNINSPSYRKDVAVSGIAAGVWYHAVGTFDTVTNVSSLYLNGTLVGSIANADLVFLNNGYYSIAGSNTVYPLNGSLDELAIYGRALSATEVTRLDQANNAIWRDLAGAGSQTYVAAAADRFSALRVGVTATNRAGSVAASSAATIKLP